MINTTRLVCRTLGDALVVCLKPGAFIAADAKHPRSSVLTSCRGGFAVDRVRAHCDLCNWRTEVLSSKHRSASFESHRMSLLASQALTAHLAVEHPEPTATPDCGA